MMIIKDCPRCCKDYMHDPNQTPQYSEYCQDCANLPSQETITIELIKNNWNNCWCRTTCLLCGDDWKPNWTLYQIGTKGYICPECVMELTEQNKCKGEKQMKQAIQTSPKELRKIADQMEDERNALNQKFVIRMDDGVKFLVPIINPKKESDTWQFEKP